MITDVATLAAAAARLGRDPDLVQGAGGNVSVKVGDILWVKASGKWLAAAEDESIFVALDLARVRSRIAAGRGEDLADAIVPTVPGLRPSIETTLHALMPHDVVLHVHSVRTIALAVRRDAEAELARRLGGLKWSLVPYRRPGWPLTQAVAAVMARETPDVLVLANHGLVVGGDTCGAASALLADVERRLDAPQRRTPTADIDRLRRLTRGTSYDLPHDDAVHALAAPPAAAIASAGSLYPDHVVFLGSGMAVLGADQALPQTGTMPAAMIVPGAGIVEQQNLSAGAHEMVRALARVVARIPDGAALRYLSPDDERALVGWDAEQFRSAMAR